MTERSASGTSSAQVSIPFPLLWDLGIAVRPPSFILLHQTTSVIPHAYRTLPKLNKATSRPQTLRIHVVKEQGVMMDVAVHPEPSCHRRRATALERLSAQAANVTMVLGTLLREGSGAGGDGLLTGYMKMRGCPCGDSHGGTVSSAWSEGQGGSAQCWKTNSL